jgi:hypothetical protein
MSEIFISHAEKDKELVDAFVDLLVTGIEINSSNFFASSLEGLGIPTGYKFVDFIEQELEDPDLVIMIITPSYYKSAFCLCELGASWILSHSIFPILVPEYEYEDLKAVLKGVQAAKINDKSKLNELRDIIIDLLNIENINTARWEAKRNQFLDKLPDIIDNLFVPKEISLDEYSKLEDKYRQSQEALKELYEENDNLKEQIKELKSCKDKEQVNDIIRNHSDDWELFIELTKNLKEKIRELPRIVREAFYYYVSDRQFIIEGWEQDKWRDIRLEEEKDYLITNEENNIVKVNINDPKIKKVKICYDELDYFLESEAKEKVYNIFEEKNHFNLKLSTRRFWTDFLDVFK